MQLAVDQSLCLQQYCCGIAVCPFLGCLLSPAFSVRELVFACMHVQLPMQPSAAGLVFQWAKKLYFLYLAAGLLAVTLSLQRLVLMRFQLWTGYSHERGQQAHGHARWVGGCAHAVAVAST
jgi:hypothetical protein